MPKIEDELRGMLAEEFRANLGGGEIPVGVARGARRRQATTIAATAALVAAVVVGAIAAGAALLSHEGRVVRMPAGTAEESNAVAATRTITAQDAISVTIPDDWHASVGGTLDAIQEQQTRGYEFTPRGTWEVAGFLLLSTEDIPEGKTPLGCGAAPPRGVLMQVSYQVLPVKDLTGQGDLKRGSRECGSTAYWTTWTFGDQSYAALSLVADDAPDGTLASVREVLSSIRPVSSVAPLAPFRQSTWSHPWGEWASIALPAASVVERQVCFIAENEMSSGGFGFDCPSPDPAGMALAAPTKLGGEGEETWYAWQGILPAGTETVTVAVPSGSQIQTAATICPCGGGRFQGVLFSAQGPASAREAFEAVITATDADGSVLATGTPSPEE